MKRYVDADKMIRDTLRLKTELKCEAVRIEDIIKYLEENATYGVQEVRNGRWIKRSGGVLFPYKCSECGEASESNEYKYCHCGAKMDDDQEKEAYTWIGF